ncbi:BlaI/MecI/CopY family transcriptional regulator [uncultured Desulfobacter sp.]|uniref:BlaI/MecI/CopY family transcriptional regulator n=1 Tax=uncultured Desulfobacter sp. TaxID=240139 RepID=UPI002AA7801B|nr:BlaI/MecI/CopY family transcriptional regulator [uncultured Desulfobacter sp.]
MPDHPKVSDAEWLVLETLWENHPAGANDIVSALASRTDWKPNTIKTLINRLVKKEVVGFEKQGRSYLYFPLVSRTKIIKKERQSFLKRFFKGAFTPMVAGMVENQELSLEEIRELRRILDLAEAGAKEKRE